MRRTGQFLAVFSLLFVLTLVGRAGEADATAIINKAIKAHFPKGVDTKKQGTRTKAKGTLHVQGLDLEFTQEVAVQKNMFKEVMELDVMGKKVLVTSVFNGAKAWIRTGDTDVPITDEILSEFKEAAYSMGIMQGMFFKDKTVKFSLIGEAKVKGNDAIGVTVSREGKKDISVYFDKKTGLMAKLEMRKRDLMSGQEVQEERFILEYQDVNGNKSAKKIEVLRDGKALLEAEVVEVQTVEKLDESEFAQPK
jgi:hypothetical protein